MEEFELVDMNGIRTGKIVTLEELENKECKTKIPYGYYLPVAGIVVMNENNEILLERRSLKKTSAAGQWGICAGKVNIGESTIEAAIREASEEIGVTFDKEKLKLLTTDLINNGRYSIYYVRTNLSINQYKIQESEVDEVKYFKINELENLENSIFDWIDNIKEIFDL